MNNKAWADRIIQKLDPSFKQRWDAYNELITSYMAKESIWVDIGCGDNFSVETFGSKARLAVGIDLLLPQHKTAALFICGDIRHLPISSEIADLVTLRFVVEHLPYIPSDFTEIERILKPGGYIVMITPNLWSPFVFVAQLLPSVLKRKILHALYTVDESEVIPTYHLLNTPSQIRKGIGKLKPVRLEFVQGASYVRRWLFLIFFLWHLFTKKGFVKVLRDNLLAVFIKDSLLVFLFIHFYLPGDI